MKDAKIIGYAIAIVILLIAIGIVCPLLLVIILMAAVYILP